MDSELGIRFWGVRGHVSSPSKETAFYGGNTTSIEILGCNHTMIIDAGFGITNLGEVLMQRILQHNEAIQANIFFTHFHWDHIQGLPFFHPIYFPTSKLNIHFPMEKNYIWPHLDILFDGSYSPFEGIDNMPSQICFEKLQKEHQQDDLKITFCQLNHGCDPKTGTQIPTFAFKFEKQGQSLVIATDHEAQDNELNQKLIHFAKGCDLLIHDGQYTEEEYQQRKGWGHSSIPMALKNAEQAGAKRLLITHHDPKRTDSEIDHLYKHYQQKYSHLNFQFAQEGPEFWLPSS